MSTLIPSGDKHDVTWKLIDADSKSVGRVATAAAILLQGKHKPSYTPFLDLGDHVAIVNAKQAKLTGNKENKKLVSKFRVRAETCAKGSTASPLRRRR